MILVQNIVRIDSTWPDAFRAHEVDPGHMVSRVMPKRRQCSGIQLWYGAALVQSVLTPVQDKASRIFSPRPNPARSILRRNCFARSLSRLDFLLPEDLLEAFNVGFLSGHIAISGESAEATRTALHGIEQFATSEGPFAQKLQFYSVRPRQEDPAA